MKRYQFVNWFPHWQGIFLTRLNPDKTDMAYIYDWYLVLGFIEIRKWTNRKVPA